MTIHEELESMKEPSEKVENNPHGDEFTIGTSDTNQGHYFDEVIQPVIREAFIRDWESTQSHKD